MRNWPALIVAPLLALAGQGINYALVATACRRDDLALLHAVSGITLMLVLGCTVLALRNWYLQRTGKSLPGDARGTRNHFMAVSGTLIGLLSAIVVIAFWLPQWIVSPCQP
jgi:hypothetical protein